MATLDVRSDVAASKPLPPLAMLSPSASRSTPCGVSVTAPLDRRRGMRVPAAGGIGGAFHMPGWAPAPRAPPWVWWCVGGAGGGSIGSAFTCDAGTASAMSVRSVSCTAAAHTIARRGGEGGGVNAMPHGEPVV